MILIATLSGIVTLVLWGLSDYFVGLAGKKASPYLVNFVVQLMGSLLLLPVVLLYGLPIPINESLYTAALVAGLFTIGFVSAIKAFSMGPFGITTPIANSYPLITILTSFIFFKLQISFNEFLALLTILGGGLLLTIDRTSLKHSTFRGSGVYFAIIAMFFWGVGFSFYDTIVDEYSWLQFLFLLNVFMMIFGFLYYVLTYRSFPKIGELRNAYKQYAWYITLASVVGSAAFFGTAQLTGSVIIPAFIASASPIVPTILGYIRHGERITMYKKIGIGIIIVGLMLLNLL